MPGEGVSALFFGDLVGQNERPVQDASHLLSPSSPTSAISERLESVQADANKRPPPTPRYTSAPVFQRIATVTQRISRAFFATYSSKTAQPQKMASGR